MSEYVCEHTGQVMDRYECVSMWVDANTMPSTPDGHACIGCEQGARCRIEWSTGEPAEEIDVRRSLVQARRKLDGAAHRSAKSQEIIAWLESRAGDILPQHMAEHMGISWGAARNILYRMGRDGVLKRTAPNTFRMVTE